MDLLELDYLSKNEYVAEKDNIKKKNLVKKERTTFVHINSNMRNKIPSNILDTVIYNLQPDALQFKENSNIVKIKIPGNSLSVGDSFILDNVESISYSGNFYITYSNFKLSISASLGTDENNFLKQLISSYTIFSEILISNLSGDDSYLTDVDKKYLFSTIPLNNVNTTFKFDIEGDTIVIHLPYELPSTTKVPPSGFRTFTIISLNLYGIPISDINANFPLDDYHSKGFHIVTSVENDHIIFSTTTKAKVTGIGGGRKMKVSKVVNRVIAYPSSAYYNITLDVTYQNVSKIKVFSSEVPYTIKTVSSTNKNFYLKFLTTADTLYSVSLNEGFFNEQNLLNQLLIKLNNISPSFVFELNTFSSLFFTIFCYKTVLLYQPFTVSSGAGSSEVVSALSKTIIINIPYHNLVTGDIIQIRNALAFLGIPVESINGAFTVTVVDTNTLSISLQNYNLDENSLSTNTNGGNQVQILLPNPVKIITGSNNLNDILGVIPQTNYSSIISNINPIKLYPSYYLELRCYANNFIDNSNNILTKIQFDGSQGSYLYDKHTNNYLEFIPPVKSLASILFQYTFSNGEQADFYNFENSFSIQITEQYYESN